MPVRWADPTEPLGCLFVGNALWRGNSGKEKYITSLKSGILPSVSLVEGETTFLGMLLPS